jgi:predicted DNA-binding transcriptional regulator YafY
MHHKSPFLRYKIINACLTDKRKPFPSIDEIKTALEKQDITIAKRAIEGDLEAMRHDKRLGYQAPIAYHRTHRGYYYTDPEYNLEKLPLSHEELEAFELIVDSFKRFRGAKILNQVEGMFDKLDKVVMHQLKNSKTQAHYPTVDFENMPFSKGIEHFDRLYKAIQKQQCLQIDYHKFEAREASHHIFHPYLLKEYKFRWYVLGFSETRKGKLVLALDRIEKITPARLVFKHYKGTDIQQYFSHTIGVTIKNASVKEIRLWFSAAQGNYIKTQYLHATQQTVSDTKDGLIITLQLIPNYELLQTLLAFGPEVKVLEPESLRTEMKDMLARNLALYK